MMEYTSVKQYASKVNRLSQRMLELARKSNWPEVARLEAERQVVIEGLFSHPAIQEQLASVADTLAEVIAFDRECILLGEQTQTSATSENCRLQQGHRAAIAYLDNSQA